MICVILLFGTFIFLHELGHYTAARITGMKVLEFSVGMGPKLLSHVHREIRYSLRLLPVGGFVMVAGESESSEDPRALCNVSLSRRFCYIVAGGLTNLLVGFLFILAFAGLVHQADITQIAEIPPESKCAEYLEQGDVIKKVNGWPVFTALDVAIFPQFDLDGKIDFEVIRGQEVVRIKEADLGVWVGEAIESVDVNIIFAGYRPDFGGVVDYAARLTASSVYQVFFAFKALFQGAIPLTSLSGPIGIASAMSTAASVSLPMLFLICGIINVSLGVTNLLPIPVLDGGHLLFLLLELLRGKPLSEKISGVVQGVFWCGLIVLMIFVTGADIIKVFSGEYTFT